jgi:hypothetical protein
MKLNLILAASATAVAVHTVAAIDLHRADRTLQHESLLRSGEEFGAVSELFNAIQTIRSGGYPTAESVQKLLSIVARGGEAVFGKIAICVDSNDERFDDTIFTIDNYLKPQFDFVLSALQPDDNKLYLDWFLKGTGSSSIKSGIKRDVGPNSYLLLGFDDVKEALESWDDKINSGDIERKNELGIQILENTMWPENPGGRKTIGLGQSKENHAFVRPLLGEALDKGSKSGTCDGSTCWNDAYLKKKAKEFFRGRNEWETADAKWWGNQVLSKIHFNVDVSEAEAKAFASYMSSMLTLIPLPQNVRDHWIIERVLKPSETMAKKAAYIKKFKNAVRAKYADRNWVGDESKVNLVASIFLDSITFAGGLSMPSVINTVFALTHMSESGKHAFLKGVPLNQDTWWWITMESLRMYAPVGGVPFWSSERMENGDWSHVIPVVAAALSDATKFPDPTVFKNRGHNVYKNLLLKNGDVDNAGMGWAGPAIGKNAAGEFDTSAPNSHNCPAQDLSMRMIKAFIEEYAIIASNYKVVNAGDLSVNAMFGGSTKFLKKGLQYTTGCAMCPDSCKSGYSKVSTKWCKSCSYWWCPKAWRQNVCRS